MSDELRQRRLSYREQIAQNQAQLEREFEEFEASLSKENYDCEKCGPDCPKRSGAALPESDRVASSPSPDLSAYSLVDLGGRPPDSDERYEMGEADCDEYDDGPENSNLDEAGSPITWQVAVASQDFVGTFQLSERLREKLESHFCPRTLNALDEALVKYLAASQLPEEERRILVDTLMMVQHFKIHMAQEQDLWGW
jgi:hypothetical protein